MYHKVRANQDMSENVIIELHPASRSQTLSTSEPYWHLTGRNCVQISKTIRFLDERIRSHASTPTEDLRSSPTLLNRWRKYIEPLSDSDASSGSSEESPVRRPKLRYVNY